MLHAVVGVDDDQQIGVLLELLTQQIAERGWVNSLLVKKIRDSLSIVMAALSAGACWPDAALGRLTGMPRYWAIDKVEIMKKTNKKNIVSIIGMISMRAFLRLRL